MERDRRDGVRWRGLLVLGGLLLLAACDGRAPAVRDQPAGGEGMQASGRDGVALHVTRADDGRRTLEIRNYGPDGLAVLAAGFDGVNRLGQPVKLAAKAGADGAFQISGQILVDDPGPQARMPMPDRLELAGSDEVTLLPGFVAPGQTLRVQDVAGDIARKEAFAELARVPAAASILRVGPPTREKAPPPDPSSRGMGGWAPVATLQVALAPLASYQGAAADRPAPTWPGPPAGELQLGTPLVLPPLRAYAAPSKALAGWPTERKTVSAP